MTNERINELTKQLEDAVSEMVKAVDSNHISLIQGKIEVQVYNGTIEKLPQENVQYIKMKSTIAEEDYYIKQITINDVNFIELLDKKEALASFKKSIA